MSVESLSRALNHPGVTSAERLVLIGIANHEGDGGSWPSIATLARYACVSERSVQRTVAVLVERGLIEVRLNAGGTPDWRDDRRPNRFVLHLDRRGDADDTPSISRGDTGDVHGVTLASPKPSKEPSNPPIVPRRGTKRASDVLGDNERAADFDKWYSAYPRREARLQALRAWRKNLDRLPDVDELIAASDRTQVRVQRDHPSVTEWRKYVPYPATWLNGHRWLDDPELTKPRFDETRVMKPCNWCQAKPPGVDTCKGPMLGIISGLDECLHR